MTNLILVKVMQQKKKKTPGNKLLSLLFIHFSRTKFNEE